MADTGSTENHSLFSKVGGLFRPSTQGSGGSRARSGTLRSNATQKKGRSGTLKSCDEKHADSSSNESDLPTTSGAQSNVDARDADDEFFRTHDRVRTLPPWIHSLTVDENTDAIDVNASLLPRPPAWARSPQRNFFPVPVDDEVATQHASRWRAFLEVSQYGRPHGQTGTIVDEEWCKANLPDMDSPWDANGVHNSDDEDLGPGMWLFTPQKRAATIKRVQRLLLNNPFVPLIIRVIVLTFVCSALGLGVTIYRHSKSINDNGVAASGGANGMDMQFVCQQQASTYMSFIVSAVAIPYLIFITQDEYFSKPLGLRSSKAKMRLLFLDLIFIVFSAANLAIAFNTLADHQWACYEDSPAGNSFNQAAAQSTCIQSNDLCSRQKALCAMLFIVLSAWLVTFATSTMRVIEKISS